MSEEQALPRGEIVCDERTVTVPDDVSHGDHDAVPSLVNGDPNGSVTCQVSVINGPDLLQRAFTVVTVRDTDLTDPAFHEGYEESGVEGVPRRRLPQPPGAAVGVRAAGVRVDAALEGEDDGEWDGREEEED